MHDCAIDTGHGGSVRERQAVGDLSTVVRCSTKQGRVCVRASHEDTIADLKVLHVRTNRLDYAGALASEALSIDRVAFHDAHGDQHILLQCQ